MARHKKIKKKNNNAWIKIQKIKFYVWQEYQVTIAKKWPAVFLFMIFWVKKDNGMIFNWSVIDYGKVKVNLK